MSELQNPLVESFFLLARLGVKYGDLQRNRGGLGPLCKSIFKIFRHERPRRIAFDDPC